MSAQLLANALARSRQEISLGGLSSDSDEAIRQLGTCRPNVALINSHLGDGQLTGYRVLQRLPMACPKAAAIMMIPIYDRDLVIDAFRGGARGIFSRFDAPRLLSKCIRSVFGGQIWVNNNDLIFLIEFVTHLKPLRLVKSGGGLRLLTP